MTCSTAASWVAMRSPGPEPSFAGAPSTAPAATAPVCAPPRLVPAARRLSKHPRLMPYHRLIALVVLINLGGAPVPPGPRRLGDRRRQRAVGARGADAGRTSRLPSSSASRTSSTSSSGWPAADRARGRCGSAGASRRCTTSAASTPAARSPAPRGSAPSPRWRPSPARASPRASRRRRSSWPTASRRWRCSWSSARHRPCGAAPTTCSSSRTGSAAGRRSRCSGR